MSSRYKNSNLTITIAEQKQNRQSTQLIWCKGLLLEPIHFLPVSHLIDQELCLMARKNLLFNSCHRKMGQKLLILNPRILWIKQRLKLSKMYFLAIKWLQVKHQTNYSKRKTTLISFRIKVHFELFRLIATQYKDHCQLASRGQSGLPLQCVSFPNVTHKQESIKYCPSHLLKPMTTSIF